MWIPITIDDYVKVHLKKNPNEKVLRVRIEAALRQAHGLVVIGEKYGPSTGSGPERDG
jgi:hypothetical protein